MRTSSRSAVDPFIVMDVMEAAAQAEAKGRDIIHMEVGQPGTSAPKTARNALLSRLEDDPMGYSVALGLPELRAGIARLYTDWYGVSLDPGRVVVTSGSSSAFILAFTALYDAGERVGIGMPGYPSYRQILKGLDLVPVDIETHATSRYQPTPEHVRAQHLDGLMVASPANPSGTMLGKPELAALIEAAHAQGAAFISDEIYHGLGYARDTVSALEVSDDVYVINSFSKYFSMTGWRIGWMVVPEDHVRRIERLAQNFFICAPHASQVAALGALEGQAELDANRDVYAANRAALLEALPAMGFDEIAPPDGAFYIYADVSRWTDDSRTFCKEVLEEAGVAITPGLDFDPKRGHQTVRFSYARGASHIAEGIERLRGFMANRSPRKA